MIPDFDDGDPTFREILDPAMKIALAGDRDEAKRYLEAYVAYLRRRNGWSQGKALQVARSNLGYGAGYYGYEEMAAVKRVFGAAHPVFG